MHAACRRLVADGGGRFEKTSRIRCTGAPEVRSGHAAPPVCRRCTPRQGADWWALRVRAEPCADEWSARSQGGLRLSEVAV